MKRLILFAALLVGAGLYLVGGVDIEAALGLNPAVTDTALLIVAALVAVVFALYFIWAGIYILSGQYALDRRLEQWVKR